MFGCRKNCEKSGSFSFIAPVSFSLHLIGMRVVESLPDYQSASSRYSTAKQKVFVFRSGLSHKWTVRPTLF